MANYANLKSAIQEVIKTNGNNEITGALLQQSLIAMINSLGANYQFAGVATPTTVPGTPDQKVFYFAGPGTYPNFNGAVIPARNVGLMSYNGTWHVSTVQTTPFSAETIVNDIIQLYDGSTPVYPRTRAEAVFFDNDTSRTLDKELYETVYKEFENPTVLSGKYIANVYGDIGENAVYSIRLIDVSSYRGQSIRVVGTCVGLASALPSFGFYSSSELSRNTLVQICTTDQEVRDSFSDLVTVPQDASYLALVQEYSSGSINFTSKGYYPDNVSRLDELEAEEETMGDAITSLSEDVEDLEEQLEETVYIELQPSSVISGKYINMIGNVVESQYYNINIVDVSSYRGQSLKVDGICKGLTSALPSFGFYSSSELSSSTLVQLSNADQEVRDSFSDLVTVPQTASYLALVQEYSTASVNFESRVYYDSGKISRFTILHQEISGVADKAIGIEYKKTGQMLSFGHLYKDRKIGYTIGPGGANTLVDFRSVYTYSSASKIDNPQDLTNIIPAVGDMHGPFQFRSDNLTTAVGFTGGNHAYDGVKTATLDYVRFYADGKEITAVNESGNCSKLEIVWSNLVKPGNAYAASDDYALRENHHMIYDGYTFDDWTELVPIVTIRMGLYYGLQLVPVSGQTFVQYAGGTNRLQYVSSSNSNSGDKICSSVIAGKDGYRLSMYIDNTFDLGKRELSDATVTGALHTGSTGKSYFTIIRSTDYSVVMNEATHYWLHGGYNFQINP